MGLPGVLLDLLVPPTCAACGEVCRRGLCPGCAARLPELALPGHGSERLAPGVRAVGAYAYEGVVRDAIRAIKVGGRHASAGPLGALMRFELGLPEPRSSRWPVTWVPSTRAVRRHRGVEVPRLLAGPGAVPLLERTRHEDDQTELDAARRRTAPLGAFRPAAPAPGLPAGRVVLVDDVRTTGATACAAAQALRQAGYREVLVVTLAVAG